MEPVAVRIDYWTLPDRSPTGIEPEGIDEFRRDLQNVYVSLVRGQSGSCGGGLYDLMVNVTSSISLRDVVNLILGGVAYDLIKSGTKSFVLKPLITAIENLKSRNKKWNLKVDELTFSFQDAEIIVKKIGQQPLSDDLGRIFKALAENFEYMKGQSGESPYAIHVPVFEDPNPRFSRFRAMLDVDETIEDINTDSYFKYWGVRYNLEGQIRVFDVQQRLLINETYMIQKEYWEVWHNEWAKERAAEDAIKQQKVAAYTEKPHN
jgi:hypothetical protein